MIRFTFQDSKQVLKRKTIIKYSNTKKVAGHEIPTMLILQPATLSTQEGPQQPLPQVIRRQQPLLLTKEKL